jgi:hypothetical protein
MSETPGALEKLYSMLREADQLGLSRSARFRLIGIIGSLETEELDRYRRAANIPPEREPERHRRCGSEDDRLLGEAQP